MDRNMIYAAGIHLREHLRHTPYKNSPLFHAIDSLIAKADKIHILSDEDVASLEKEFYTAEKLGNFSPSITLDGTLGVFALVLRVYSSQRKPALRVAAAVEGFRQRIQKKNNPALAGFFIYTGDIFLILLYRIALNVY